MLRLGQAECIITYLGIVDACLNNTFIHMYIDSYMKHIT